MVHFNLFLPNTLLGWAALLTRGMANPKLQRVEPHRFMCTAGHYGVRGLMAQLLTEQLHRLREDGGDMADTLYPVLVVDPANVHRKMDSRKV